MSTNTKDRLAISFWIWALWDTAPNGFFNDLETRMAELVERGFNCVRLESGAGLAHDAEGRPRGTLDYLEAVPGHCQVIRQMERMRAGRCDVLKRLIELCTAAKRHQVKVILSSWYFLHTFWFTDHALTAELLGLPVERRFMYFAQALDWLLSELKQQGLADVIAFAEIFNETDGLEFLVNYVAERGPEVGLPTARGWHEEALAFLRGRHPDILFAVDTYTPGTTGELLPHNAQVWNFHSYYLWSVYGIFENPYLSGEVDLDDPVGYAPIRRYLQREVVPFRAVVESRLGRPPIMDNWYRRIWLYRNLEPNTMHEVERLLWDNLERHVEDYKQAAEAGLKQALALRDEYLPGVPLVTGEGVTYCGDNRLRWEERSDAYWEIAEHSARLYRDAGLWGSVARTNSGPEDPVWWEYPERLQRVNAVFLGKAE